MKDRKIYIGYDSKEPIASEICEFSLNKNSSKPIKINHIKLNEVKNKNIYWRETDKLGSTEFTFTRFLVPFLQNYNGWALFCDSDFLWLEDVNELFSIADNKYAIMCVHHDYKPKNTKKKLLSSQQIYPRKNWSSLVLWNCSHPSNKKVTPDLVNTETGKFMHRFGWLKDEEIGAISHEWNWLIGWYKEPEDGKPKALHYTEGGPWLGSDFQKKEYAEEWNKYFRLSKKD
tara:strand:- start:117 stop:806 length:690 start_codon:yes stop_codon:yes gene_type:complete